MKLRKAKFYREIVRKITPQFKTVMSIVSMAIADATAKGYTTTAISLPELLSIYDIAVEEGKLSTLRNLIIKELEKKGFTYKCEAEQVLKVFW